MIDYASLKQAMTDAGFTLSTGDGWTATDQQQYLQYTYHYTNVPKIPSLYGLQYEGILPEGFPGTGGEPTPAPTLGSIAVTSEESAIPIGDTLQMVATGTYNDSSTKDITGIVSWSSSDPAIATIDNTGLVTSVATGTVTITAEQAGVTGDTSIEVTAATVASLNTTGGTTVAVGGSVQLTATATFSDGSSSDVTTTAEWTSSDTDVATVSEGMVTGVSEGNSTIWAEYEGVSQTVEMTVTAE